jgi:nicotinate-nucleotide--dimethylbenzimidazole phosphoribosyltransferase
VGAGPLPRVGPTDHPPRPPIPIVALDEAAIAAARERGASEVAVWLAGVAGAERPVRALRVVVEQGGDEAAAAARDDPGATEPLSVAEIAAAVDAGRDLAGAAAADGIAVLIASASAADGPARPVLAALAADESRPLRALRLHGTDEIATVCGIALGAGERGLGCVCDGIAALAGAAVAAAIEPALRPRLRALTDREHARRLSIAPIDAALLEAALD